MTFRSSSVYQPGGFGSSAIIPVPAGAAVGDIAVVALLVENAQTINPPDGTWTQKFDSQVGAQIDRLTIFWKRLTAAETGTWTFTWGSGTDWREGVAGLWSGRVTTGDPFSTTPTSVDVTANATSMTIPGLTASAGDDVIAFGEAFDATDWSTTGSLTERVDGPGMFLYTGDNVAAGAVAGQTYNSTVSTVMKGWMGTLATAVAPPPTTQAAFASIASGGSSGGNIVVTKPTGTASGDLLLAVGYADPDGTTFDAPSGFVQHGATLQNTVGDLKIWWKAAGGSEPADYTFTADANAARVVYLMRITGADLIDPFDADLATDTGGVSASHVAPSASPTGPTSLLVAGAMGLNAGNGVVTYTSPGTMIERGDQQSPVTNWIYTTVATQELSAPGATGTRTFVPTTQKIWNAFSLAIKSATGVSGVTLDAMWEADDLNAQAEASAVASWADKITAKTLTQATGANQPTLRKAVLNGKSVVRFDGGDFLTATGIGNGRAASWTRTLVVKVPNIGGAPQKFTGGQNTFPEGMYSGRQGYGIADKWGVGVSAVGTFATSTTSLDDAFHALTVSWDHTTQTATLYKDGAPDGSGVNVDAPDRVAQTLILGGDSLAGSSDPLIGDVAAVYQANRVLTAQERAAVHAHVQTTYGITVSLASDPDLRRGGAGRGVQRLGQIAHHGLRDYDDLYNFGFTAKGAEIIQDFKFGWNLPGELAFEDTFDGGALDTTKWTVRTGAGSQIDGGDQTYHASQVSVSGGALRLGLIAGTAGGSAGNEPTNRAGTAAGFNNPAISLVNPFASSGTVSSVEAYFGAGPGGNTWRAIIARQNGAGQWQVVHVSAAQSITVSSLNTITGLSWAVQAGDFVGVWTTGNSNTLRATTTGGSWQVLNSGFTLPVAGTTYPANGAALAYTVSVRANIAAVPPLAGRVESKDKIEFHYGRVEAQITLPAGGQGLWPAFWMMLDEEASGLWPRNGEIDIMESINAMKRVYGSVHGPTVANPANQWFDELIYVPTDAPITGPHLYALEWEPDALHWYFDNVKFRTLRRKDVNEAVNSWPFNKAAGYLILNVAYGGIMAGAPDGTAVLPQEMAVDYVRVYERQPYPAVNAKVGTLVLNFADAREVDVDGVVAKFTGDGTLTVDCANGYYNGSTQRRFDLVDSSVYYSLVQLPNVGNGTTSAFMKIDNVKKPDGTIGGIEFGWNGSLYTHETVAGGSDTFQTYDPVAHKYLRVRYLSADRTLRFDTSPDASTWTEWVAARKTLAPLTDLSNIDVLWISGFWGTEPNPGTAKFDNVNTPGVVANPKTATLVQDFSTTAEPFYVDWDGADVRRNNGRLEIDVLNTYPNSPVYAPLYDFRDSSIFAELVTPPNVGLGSTGTDLQVFLGNGRRVSIGWTNNTLYMMEDVNTGSANASSIAYDPVAHRCMRIRHGSGNFYWETSPDGVTWTVRRTVALTNDVGTDMAACTVRFQAGYWNVSETNPGIAVWDNVNTVPAALVTEVEGWGIAI